jgi:uncharacterized protein YutD
MAQEMKNFQGSFEHYLEEWSTEQFPDVLVNYTFIPGDKTVGERDLWEIYVIRNKKDIWEQLTSEDRLEVEEYCKENMEQAIREASEP